MDRLVGVWVWVWQPLLAYELAAPVLLDDAGQAYWLPFAVDPDAWDPVGIVPEYLPTG